MNTCSIMNSQCSGPYRCGPISHSPPPIGHKILPVLPQKYFQTLSRFLQPTVHGLVLIPNLLLSDLYPSSPPSPHTFMFMVIPKLLSTSRTTPAPQPGLQGPSFFGLHLQPPHQHILVLNFLLNHAKPLYHSILDDLKSAPSPPTSLYVINSCFSLETCQMLFYTLFADNPTPK